MSGVPVYSTNGRGGGWELIGGASTDLTGLSADEARALFLAAGPAMTDTPELKSALRKLTSALPAPFQAEAEAATTAFKIDSAGWGQVGHALQPRFLEPLTDATVRSRQVRIDYQGRTSDRRWRTVHPLGLVTKRNVWYLVAATDDPSGGAADGDGNGADHPVDAAIRTFRVSRVRGVEVLDEAVVRPEPFDLDRAWQNIVTEVERRRTTIQVRALIEGQLLNPLQWVFGRHQVVTETGESKGRSDGRKEVVIEAHSPRSFAGQIAGFGDKVEILDAPDQVYAELADLGRQLHARYCR